MRVLIFGSTGMLGHKLAQVLSRTEEVIAAIRGNSSRWPGSIAVSDVVENVDVRDINQVARVMDHYRPEAVINAAGVIKHVLGAHDPCDVIEVNALYPKLLAQICSKRGIRMIHYSTDCVFSGSASSERGSNGYRECDQPDARDLYGISKLLGEPCAAEAVVLRTSIIGRELQGRHGLVEWFLSQKNNGVHGFTRALFTGLPTLELAHLTATILRDHPTLNGIWHVAADPISKYDLLRLLQASHGRDTVIHPCSEFYCDRRLDAGRFALATGWKAAAWPDLIRSMTNDDFDYEEYAGSRKSAS